VQHKFFTLYWSILRLRTLGRLPGWINRQVVMLPSIETGEFIVTQLIYLHLIVLVDIFYGT
jgi:hypothetical protein